MTNWIRLFLIILQLNNTQTKTDHNCCFLPCCFLIVLNVVITRTASVVYWSECPAIQIQRPGFDSRHYQIFWEVVGLEGASLDLVSKIEELPGKNSSGFGLENREYGRRDPSRWPRDTLYPQKLALTLPTSSGHSVGIVRLRIKTAEFVFSSKWVVKHRDWAGIHCSLHCHSLKLLSEMAEIFRIAREIRPDRQ
jgi:hypothetical protein